MYLLRKLELKKSFKSNDVKDVLNYIIDECNKMFGVGFKLYENMPKITVTNFLINGANGVSVLQELHDKYGLSSFLMDDETLYCGLAYGYKGNRIKYVLNKNTINIDDLKFTASSDKTYKVKFVVNGRDGKKKEYEFGDKHGVALDKVVLSSYHTDDEVKLMAKAHLDAFKTAGYKGSFTTFIKPAADVCDIADVNDLQFANRSGSYYISSVETNFGVGGGTKKIEIDFKI